jgi:hypothetical protein
MVTMMKKVQIACPKDPLVEKYCRDTFEEKFNRVLSWGNDPQDELKMFRNALVKEARRQKWYDFEVTDEDQTDWQGNVIGKKRRVLLDEDGTKKLLVPEVELIDVGGS